MPERLKILLISPGSNYSHDEHRFFRFPPLNLAVLAALAPENEYCVIDENIAPVDMEAPAVKSADLVGITVMTTQAPRAYQVADELRRCGKTVVMGGMHVSALPEEGLEHADCVVIGEAEGLWPQLLDDFRRTRLEKVYRSSEFCDMRGLPVPNRSLFDRKHYLGYNTIHVSRGCPFNCSFCSVSHFFGARYRFRPVEEVIEEIEEIIRLDNVSLLRRAVAALWGRPAVQPVAFLDDNIFGSKDYAENLFQKLVPLRIYWGGQASINIARPENEHLLELAAKSGCRFLFVGLESMDEEALAEAGKRVNHPQQYQEAVRLLHKHGITVLGAFIFGLDHDDVGTFDRTVKFAQSLDLDAAQFTILTPLPKTPLMDKLQSEHRIFNFDWAKYDFRTCVFSPRNMTKEELVAGCRYARKQFYSISSIVRRLPPITSPSRLVVYLILNFAYRAFGTRARLRVGEVSVGKADEATAGSKFAVLTSVDSA